MPRAKDLPRPRLPLGQFLLQVEQITDGALDELHPLSREWLALLLEQAVQRIKCPRPTPPANLVPEALR